MITLSVVSHRQNALVNQLLSDLARIEGLALVVTENVADDVPISTSLAVERIANATAKGFGANHNAAFQRCRTPYFCVVNPDIRLPRDPFPRLLESLKDVVGPMVRTPEGTVEDSARRFPTVGFLLRKFFSDKRQPDYPVDRGAVPVDWVAGMFMLFRSDAYREVGGFDERYFLYYEDVDLCRRLRARGGTVVFEPRAEVVHDAQRASRRQLGRALHHARSALRFLSS